MKQSNGMFPYLMQDVSSFNLTKSATYKKSYKEIPKI